MVVAVVVDEVPQLLLMLLREKGFKIHYYPGIDESQLVKLAYSNGIDVLIVRSRFRVGGDLLERLARVGLRVIARHGVGLDNIDVGSAERLGVKVVNAPGASRESVAELTIFLMIAAARRVKEAMSRLEEGAWSRPMGMEIYGKKLAIVGFGRIGSRVAEIAVRAFNMEVHAYDIRPLRREAEKMGVVFEDSLDKALRGADILSIHVPLTASTWHMIGAGELQMLRRGAIVINTARGGVVDEEALLRALDEGWIGAAGLDVFEYEPPRTSIERRLLSHPRVIATPHIGAQTREAQERVSRMLAEKIESALRDATLTLKMKA